jgi:hypothetical protein
MAAPRGPGSPRSSFLLVMGILAILVFPAALTLRTVRVAPTVDLATPNLTPYGYTISLLLFLVPIAAIVFWFVPKEGVKISKASFAITIAILFPLGASLDFFFARTFLEFPNANATLRIAAPAFRGTVPLEEYIFYFTGFVAVLLIYIWLDEFWLAAYSIPVDAAARTGFTRLVRFHPQSLLWAVLLVAAAILFKLYVAKDGGFPGYFTFLVVGALAPSMVLFPSALPVINWRAFSLTLFIILLISLLWEATLALPYGWWGYQSAEMVGIHITAWSGLPIEAVVVWFAVTYATTIVYEVVRCWQASGKGAIEAFFG